MTPQERAMKLGEKIWNFTSSPLAVKSIGDLVELIASEIQAACQEENERNNKEMDSIVESLTERLRQETCKAEYIQLIERERCAKIVDEYTDDPNSPAPKLIVRRIRSGEI